MNSNICITAPANDEVVYRMFFEDGRLHAIHVIGPGIEDKFYTREPRPQKHELTQCVFGEIVSHICKTNLESVAELKEALRGDAEYYKVLSRTLVNIFEQYQELLMM